ncbi:lipoprotein [Aeromonas sanarellii]|uniref:Lipoprotein n=1 Tax=Aeromonas sanarellii TaxID=633415 RepID=A0ABS4B7W3_9GAMM|nr:MULTISPECIES: lipoprotein [Aeromonas]MBP0602811.1 lipoprotein [Aeromonas sanarellii]QXC31006.1 lipoprotein [Aeromonas sp. FDAARGOS 1409]
MITQFTKCLFAASLSLGLAACGLTGPLYMPPAEQSTPAEQAPAQPKTESTPQAASPATAKPASEAAPQ